MIAALLPALLVAVADPALAAPTSAATATPTSAPRALELSTNPSLGGAAAAVTLLAALAAVALVAARRRMRPGARVVEVLETTHLGPKRALVVARVQGEVLLLASSEAGISVLQTRPALAPAAEPAPADLSRVGADAAPARAAGLLGRLRLGRTPAAGPPAFDALLHESAEDLELRRKLAHGLAGSVR